MPSEDAEVTIPETFGFDKIVELIDKFGCTYKGWQLIVIPGTEKLIANLGQNKRVICVFLDGDLDFQFRRSNVFDPIHLRLPTQKDPTLVLRAILNVCEQYQAATEANPQTPITYLPQ